MPNGGQFIIEVAKYEYSFPVCQVPGWMLIFKLVWQEQRSLADNLERMMEKTENVFEMH